MSATTDPASLWRRRSVRIALAITGTVAATTIAAGPLIERAGTELGVPLPPFNMFWRPQAQTGWLLAALAALAATIATGPTLMRRPRPPLAFAAIVAGIALALRLLVTAARSGPEGWYRVFDADLSFEAKNEYLPGLGALEYGPRFFLDRFAELVPALPVHSAGHPPGLLLILHALGITTAQGMAALCIGAAALAAPLTYALARTLLPEEGQARWAGLLCALSPSGILMGAVTADALYAAVGAGAAALLLARRAPPRTATAAMSGTARRDGRLVAGAAVFAVGSMLSWALLAVGAITALAVWVRDGWRSAFVLATSCGVALVVVHAGLALAVGWDPIGTVRATEEVYRAGIASIRPYAFWVIGSPVGAITAMGLPLLAGLVVAACARQPMAVAVVAVLAISAAGGFTKGEVERIWVMFVPFVCVAAAGAIPVRWVRATVAVLALQVLATELLFDTLW